MGCWFVCPIDRFGAHEKWLAIARDQFKLHGHASPVELRTADHVILAADAIHRHAGNILDSGDGFVAVAGTLFYRGRFRADALRSLLTDFKAPFEAWDDIVGQFGAVVCKDGQIHIFGDYFATFNVFESGDGRFLSTSFLTLTRVLDQLTVDPQSVYEFAYTSGVLGNGSLFKEIRRLAPRRQLTLGPARREYQCREILHERHSGKSSVDDLIAQQARQLGGIGQIARRTFGSKVYCPLSGGYDSRLLLAVLRNAGIDPRVYVYGAPGTPDVRIAQDIGAAEGFAVEHIDKKAYRDSTVSFAAHVEQDFNRVDGMSVDGSVFDNGGNAAARDRLQRDATLTSSGGGGEIFRNFFRLRDRPFDLSAVVRAFYHQFDPRTAVAAFDVRRYDEAIEAKMAETLGAPSGPIDRRSIELLYPAFRCRANFGREISIVGRYGAYLLPFLEPSTVRLALQIPLNLKNDGRYEALLIQRMDSSLARYRTVYGPSALEPRWRARLEEWESRARPIWLRGLTYKLKSTFAHQHDGHGPVDRVRLGAVVDLTFPGMRRYFRPEVFRDDGLLRRVALMEYLVTRLGSKVAFPAP